MRLRHRSQMWVGHRIPPAGTVTPPVDPCVANLDNGLIAYWDADSVPNTDDVAGRVMAATAGPTSSAAGKIGNAWRQTGSPGPRMSAPDDAALRLLATNFTIRFWVRFIDLDPGFHNDVIVKYSTPGLSGWGFRTSPTNKLLFILGNGSTLLSIDGGLEIDYNIWYHVVTVFNLLPVPNARFYLNAAGTAPIANSQFVMASTTDDLVVGSDPAGGTNGANMDFDEFLISNFPWTQCEVDADYASGAGLTNPFV